MRAALLAFAFSIIAAPSFAQTVKAGALTISGMELRATAEGLPTSAAYLTITNSGDRPDKLVSVSCACAGMVMAHRTETKNGLSSMADVGAVAIAAKGKAVFAPDGLHLMLMGLKGPLKDGSKQAMTLRFERAGTVKVEFQVKALIAAKPQAPAKDDMANMPGMGH